MKPADSLVFLCFALSSSAFGQVPTKHMIGESVADFAVEVGVDMDACHKLNLSASQWDLMKQEKKLHVSAATCKGLIAAERGNRVEIGKDGQWSAVLDGGRLVSYYDGHVDSSKLASPSSLPSVPDQAYEIKGDKLGMSLSEYLQKHPNDCMAQTISPKPGQFSKPVDPNSFHLSCTNFERIDPKTYERSLSLASVGMDWQNLDFSEQRLYRIAYTFQHSVYAVVESALEVKYGKPTSVKSETLQNGFGANFTRSLVVWKNGVSTITLSEMVGTDLTLSRLELTLDDVYARVEEKEGHKLVQEAVKDM